jgi:hypothetical protein
VPTNIFHESYAVSRCFDDAHAEGEKRHDAEDISCVSAKRFHARNV